MWQIELLPRESLTPPSHGSSSRTLQKLPSFTQSNVSFVQQVRRQQQLTRSHEDWNTWKVFDCGVATAQLYQQTFRGKGRRGDQETTENRTIPQTILPWERLGERTSSGIYRVTDTLLTLTLSLQGSCYPHFIDQEVRAETGPGACPKFSGQWLVYVLVYLKIPEYISSCNHLISYSYFKTWTNTYSSCNQQARWSGREGRPSQGVI